ncbi:MAG: 3-hydroxyacyl-CoA dehydrogenase family protein [Alphaproteobacteria bacterium]
MAALRAFPPRLRNANEAGKIADNGSIRRIGVCGAGQMGAAAAICYQRAGYEVLLWSRDEADLAGAQTKLIALEAWLDKHTGPAPAPGGACTLTADLDRIDQEADLVMDCIVEEMDQKVGLFRRLPAAIERGALFITTTSGLSITEMGAASGTEHLLVGTHFWNPPHLMPLVEVVRGRNTPQDVLDRVVDVVESIGKIAVRVEKDVPGFIGNRLLHALWREAIYLIQAGIASPEDVDLVARYTFGLRMPAVGPLENMDLVGLDLIDRIHAYLPASLCNDPKPLRALVERVQRGDIGMKSGRGFYDWSERDAAEVMERRDRQIIHQLEFFKELDNQ